jgi:hypothetical protein
MATAEIRQGQEVQNPELAELPRCHGCVVCPPILTFTRWSPDGYNDVVVAVCER